MTAQRKRPAGDGTLSITELATPSQDTTQRGRLLNHKHPSRIVEYVLEQGAQR